MGMGMGMGGGVGVNNNSFVNDSIKLISVSDGDADAADDEDDSDDSADDEDEDDDEDDSDDGDDGDDDDEEEEEDVEDNDDLDIENNELDIITVDVKPSTDVNIENVVEYNDETNTLNAADNEKEKENENSTIADDFNNIKILALDELCIEEDVHEVLNDGVKNIDVVIDYKKASLNKLRRIVLEKGLTDDSSKLKKFELLQLLEPYI